ncbi:MAG: 1-acyl-sn-glycerol-3-phosphate acyltransferase [Paludibacter sp.]|nr:1-acyl-sn-glycerol-3-phosphate acyltransferase [Bacteroidales bacterium]MCM1069979.1 1-acyl-sn-glycerol-3-phosphate acyltransferase [Prevotella sp.]MCM1354632.1 1-acyl-sn-glycerol-3-phosphate acyltransferase [Bacteroides sp.]MCM1443573.1 1-acyl-sn-glycerol-3-phosphate acyltransferase [Muribaculum sp.]MCM1482489.1 1-acyl-sn-glycerol-3-phosphate acyltransferase [Paludibacter sp.]
MTEDFSNICAYENDMLADALQRVAAEPSFLKVVTALQQMMPAGTFQAEQICQTLTHITDVDELDNTIVLPLLDFVRRTTTQSLSLQGIDSIDLQQPALFLTNHRDIVLDSAFLSVLLKQRTGERIYIGIGNNLFAQPWIEDFVRANKSFSVIRGGLPRQIATNSANLSAYIHHVIGTLRHSVWLAQREGRAKDSNDRTQPAILKMLSMAGEGSFLERIQRLNICPVALSYEYDPCDRLKAREMQLKRDNPDYKKTRQEDLLNMQTGILGNKGNVIFHLTPSINSELEQVAHQTNVRNEQITLVTEIIDRHIHANYHIFNTNRIAYDLLKGEHRFTTHYTQAEKDGFMAYIDAQIAQIALPDKDVPFLQEKILEMYANPLINHMAAKEQ